jgi:hypothetical protein
MAGVQRPHEAQAGSVSAVHSAFLLYEDVRPVCYEMQRCLRYGSTAT